MLHRTACHACLLQQPNIEKSESEFHFGTTYAVAVVATWRIGAKLPCVAVCTCRVPRTCRGVKKFRFSMGTISFIFRSQKTISISVKNLGYMHILPFWQVEEIGQNSATIDFLLLELTMNLYLRFHQADFPHWQEDKERFKHFIIDR